MPVPLVIAGVALVNFVRIVITRIVVHLSANWFQYATLVVTSWGLFKDKIMEFIESEDTKAYLLGFVGPMIRDIVEAQLGITLDADDPFSIASISAGIGTKVGIPLTNVTDRNALLNDMGAYLAGRVNDQMLTGFTTFWPLDTLPTQFADEAVVAVEKSLRSQVTWIPPAHVAALRNALKTLDVAYPMEDAKAVRKRTLHKLAQRKYAAANYRPGPWVPKPPGMP